MLRESFGAARMWWTALLFPVALGILGLVFRRYALTSGYSYPLVMALFGGALLGVAIMTFVYAMYSVCRGNYDLLHDATACTYQDTRAHGM